MNDKRGFAYCDTDLKLISDDICVIFPDWGDDENLCVMSPHDDDAVIGAGYAMLAAQAAGSKIYLCIFCKGDAGYSSIDKKYTIEQVRKEETYACYEKLGVLRENIIRLDFGDFSAISNLGWTTASGKQGDMPRMLKFFRDHKITRILVPNHYREHIDHTAAHMMASYNAPQSGDPVLTDYGAPHSIRSVLEYSVWADFDPLDAVVQGRGNSIRANRIIIAPDWAEKLIDESIMEYHSQSKIIHNLIDLRAERKLTDGRYLEMYIAFDPRPKMMFSPYIELVEKLQGIFK